MAETFVTSIEASSPMCEHLRKTADAVIAAGHGLAIELQQPGDTPEDFEVAGVSHAFQTLILQARRTGMGDNALFTALATVIGSFALRQSLGPIDTVCEQLGIQGAQAARLASEATPSDGFPTRGNA